MSLKISELLQLPLLPLYRMIYFGKTDKKSLPGLDFDKTGREIGLELLLKGILSPRMLFNPVSIVRYFEFDYVYRNIIPEDKIKVLDVSSPFLFGFYLCKKHTVDYNYINPDTTDLYRVQKFSSNIKFSGGYSSRDADAVKLPFESESFNRIVSISVIEHINGSGDSEAIAEMWRVLKPGGRLILTFPVAKKFAVEYTSDNTYNLNVDSKDDKYFFQRIYDEQNIESRLLNHIRNAAIISKEFFGEKEKGFYSRYVSRWTEKGIIETVKDPYYISKYFTYFKDIKDLPGLGVIGITLRKES